jgi:DNA-binding transcriptional ArsR family regulator
MFYSSRTRANAIKPSGASGILMTPGIERMSERNFPHPKAEQIELSALLFALSDPTRLGIVAALADGAEHSAGELAGALAGAIPKSTMSHHLKILREAGLTMTRPEGMRCRITLRRGELERRFPGVLDTILKHAEP